VAALPSVTGELPPGARISVLAISRKRIATWYQVRASSPSDASLGSGWINGTALYGQTSVDPKEQMRKQGEFMDVLTREYKMEVATKNGLTEEQLRDISMEGVSKNWPMP